MAAFANQEAVAMSSRVSYEVVTAGTPRAAGAIEQLDQLLAETIRPTEILTTRLMERTGARAELAEREQHRQQARTEIETAQTAGLDTLDLGTLTLLLDELTVAYEPYHPGRYAIEREIRQAIKARQEQADQQTVGPQPEAQDQAA